MNQFLHLKPDSESHCSKKINDENIEITFRYFSPSKFRQSSIHSNKAIRSGQSESFVSSRRVDQQHQQERKKVEHNPQANSDKFYEHRVTEVQYCLLNYYEQFQQKLLNRNAMKSASKDNKKIKIKLTREEETCSKSKEKGRKVLKSSKKYIKNVQINLNKQEVYMGQRKIPTQNISSSQKSYKRKPIFTETASKSPEERRKPNENVRQIGRNACKIKIKLYEHNKTERMMSQNKQSKEQDNFVTPRKKNHSGSKGISVYSSLNKSKQSLSDLKVEYNQSANLFSGQKPNDHQQTVRNININSLIQPNKQQLKTNVSTIEKSPQKTTYRRKRVHSKQKIHTTPNPMKKSKANKYNYSSKMSTYRK